MKLSALALAISFCRPTLPAGTATEWARIVADGAARSEVDPLLVVALVDHESRWTPGATNPKSGALGLGQILPQFRPACASPKSPACAEEKKKLLGAAYNLRAVFTAIDAWKVECRARTGTAQEDQWLRMYAGQGTKFCGRVRPKGTAAWAPLPIPSVVRAYLARRRSLRLRLESLPPGP